jgi:hypothetical protein
VGEEIEVNQFLIDLDWFFLLLKTAQL